MTETLSDYMSDPALFTEKEGEDIVRTAWRHADYTHKGYPNF